MIKYDKKKGRSVKITTLIQNNGICKYISGKETKLLKINHVKRKPVCRPLKVKWVSRENLMKKKQRKKLGNSNDEMYFKACIYRSKKNS